MSYELQKTGTKILKRLRQAYKEVDGTAPEEYEEGYKAALEDAVQIVKEEL